jgi:hypothetical protein
MGKNQDPRSGINIPNPQHWLETDKQGGGGVRSGKLKRNNIVYKGVGKFFAK